MGISIIASHTDLAVEPGHAVTTELRVRNNGSVVDQISFQPLGDHTDWVTVEPPLLRLFPDTDAVATMTIAPPRSPASTAGVSAWGVKARSQEDPDGAAVAEGSLDVAEFSEFGAELQPTTGRGRLSGRFDIAADNHGNTMIPLRLSAADADQRLGFTFSQPAIESEPGSANFSKLRIKPDKRIWRGPPVSHPFEVLVEPQIVTPAAPPELVPDTTENVPDGGVALSAPPAAPAVSAIPSTTITGTYLQERVIPPWFFKALAAAVVLVVALWILWQTLVKPNVESAAREVAIEEVAEVATEVDALEEEVQEVAEEAAEQVAELEEDIETGDVVPAGADPEAAAGDGGSTLGGTINESSRATTFRVVVPAAVGAQSASSGPAVAPGDILALTDLVLQNPRNDSGEMVISIGDRVLFETALQSFRTLDFHTIAPHVVAAGETVSVSVRCDAGPLETTSECSSSVLFSGFMTTLEPSGSQT